MQSIRQIPFYAARNKIKEKGWKKEQILFNIINLIDRRRQCKRLFR